MNVRDLIEQGYLRVQRPRGLATLEHVTYPPRQGERIRTSWDPRKGHYVMPGTDHSFCGLGLCPPEDEDFGINTGWDEVWYFVYDDRDVKTLCKQCSDKWSDWRTVHRDRRALPQNSPISQREWARIGEERMRPLNALEERRWQMLISSINSVLPVEEVNPDVETAA